MVDFQLKRRHNMTIPVWQNIIIGMSEFETVKETLWIRRRVVHL